MSEDWLARLQAVSDTLCQLVTELAAGGAMGDDTWMFPVENPVEWYCAVQHDLSGKLNGGYRHTGIDLNLDRRPWGDVERGAPIYALASGIVMAATCSPGWLGVVQVMHTHLGLPVWTRYAHLDASRLRVSPGQVIQAGQVLGHIGNWIGGDGGDHLHLDMAFTSFYWAAWRSATDEWVDPAQILKQHLDPLAVDGLMRRGD